VIENRSVIEVFVDRGQCGRRPIVWQRDVSFRAGAKASSHCEVRGGESKEIATQEMSLRNVTRADCRGCRLLQRLRKHKVTKPRPAHPDSTRIFDEPESDVIRRGSHLGAHPRAHQIACAVVLCAQERAAANDSLLRMWLLGIQ
jgi:hypothetical protein